MAIRFTTSEIQDRMNLKHGGFRVQLLGKFTGTEKVHKYRCVSCGYRWSCGIRNILYRGTGCPKCAITTPTFKASLQTAALNLKEKSSDTCYNTNAIYKKFWRGKPTGFLNRLCKSYPAIAKSWIDILCRVGVTQGLEAVYMFKHSLTKRPSCKRCGKPVTFHRGEYHTFCSRKCLANDAEVDEKKRATCLARYGVDRTCGCKYRRYRIAGRRLLLQGYEPAALKVLLREGYEIQNILTHHTDRDTFPVFEYYSKGKTRRYTPDFWLVEENTVVEVKSLWTMGLTYNSWLRVLKRKRRAVLRAGYGFKLILIHEHTQLEVNTEDWHSLVAAPILARYAAHNA